MPGDYLTQKTRWLKRVAWRSGFARSPLGQLLMRELWFRVALAGFLTLGLALALCLPKIWRATPPGFTPVFRVSVIDMAQARSLKRTAIEAEVGGNKELAFASWRGAIEANPSNPETIRNFIRYLIRNDDRLTSASLTIGQTSWLLRLSATNSVDLEIAAEAFEKYRMPARTIALLEPLGNKLTDKLTDKLYAARLKAMFDLGQMEAFAQLWEKCPPPLKQDAELKLYYAAYLAGWQPAPVSMQGRQCLSEAMGNSDTEILASRLALRVFAKSGDLSRYEAALARLEKTQAHLGAEHVALWKMMLDDGRKAKAVELANAYTNTPLTAMEVKQFSVIYQMLDLRDKARKTLIEGVKAFDYASGLWESLAETMIQERQWFELQALALELREKRSVQDEMGGYSHYIEGRAQLGMGRPNDAAGSFKQALAAKYARGDVALAIAGSLIKLGYAEWVRDFLARFEKSEQNKPAFWHAVYKTAYQLKDDNLLRQAAARAYELSPNDAVTKNNYAATLLLLRQKPDEAVKLTKQLTIEHPGSLVMAYNHSLALLLSKRISEAEQTLKAISPEKLKTEEANDYRLAWFDLYFHKKQWRQARDTAARIQTNDLFAAQRDWYWQSLREMPPE